MGWLAAILKFLPMIMQIIAIFTGGGALKSINETGFSGSDPNFWSFGVGQAGIAGVSAWLAHVAAAKSRSLEAESTPFSLNISGLSGMWEFFQFVFAVFQKITTDPDLSAQFKKLFGIEPPASAREVGKAIEIVTAKIRNEGHV